jgi:hypothetical protein
VVLDNGEARLTFKEGKDVGGGKGFVYGGATTAALGVLLGQVSDARSSPPEEKPSTPSRIGMSAVE